MHDLLSPKQVAQALQVSESSVKRWCDKGSIATTYTEGGHRRIRLADLAGFVRTKNLAIQDFASLGLQDTGPLPRELDALAAAMTQALLDGDEDRCTQMVMELYLAKRSVHEICDQLIATAFHQIGDQWACGEADVYQERRGCRIAQRILGRLHLLLPQPAEDSPLALGCSASGDNYCLASTMVELVLRDAGWRASSLGENLPLSSLANAIEHHQPRLAWVSCSHIPDVEQFLADYASLFDAVGSQVDLVVGGRALTPALLQRMRYSSYCRTMDELHQLARQLDPRAQRSA